MPHHQDAGLRGGGDGGVAGVLTAVGDQLGGGAEVEVLHGPGAAGLEQGGDVAVVAEAEVVPAVVDEGDGEGVIAGTGWRFD